MDIASQTTAWRRFKGLTQSALAKRAGLTQPYISRLERGELDPTLSSIRILAAALEIPAGRLLDEVPPRTRLDRFDLDRLARGSVQPGAKDVEGDAEVRALARIIRDRRQALGLYRPRTPGRPKGNPGKHSLRWLKARLGNEQFEALLSRIDKLVSLHAD